MEDVDGAFKKPIAIEKIGKSGQKSKDDLIKIKEESVDDADIKIHNLSKETISAEAVPSKPATTNSTKFCNPYKEPKWSQKPEIEDGIYSFEVIKSGVILENIQLNSKSYWTFGRLEECDIIMAHPTISRYHAVLQFRPVNDDNRPKGWYIYDLNSTHGTFLNKNKIPQNTYVPVKPGFILRLGASTRNYILQGNNNECEENQMTITEMIQQKEDLRENILKKQMEINQKNNKKETEGIDWGMGEDADEESDLSENPFAMTNHEELFLDDPKKTLRGFFEREGLDLIYDVEDKGPAHFVCRIELPVDDINGRPITAECSHHGKKKEVVVQCALEACRILDRFGVLRQSNHEPHKRKPVSSDSDEDDFLDRTGEVERKKFKKMQQSNKKPATYDDLLKDEKDLLTRIADLDSKLTKPTNIQNDLTKSEDNDALDKYMSELQDKRLDSITRRRIMMELKRLKEEHINLQKLLKIAEPNKLPDLNLPTADTSNVSVTKDKKAFYPLFGKRNNLKKKNSNNMEIDKESSNGKIKLDGQNGKEIVTSTSNIEESSLLANSKCDSRIAQVSNSTIISDSSVNPCTNRILEDEIKMEVGVNLDHIKPDTSVNIEAGNTIEISSTKSSKSRRARFRDRTKDERSTDNSEKIDELGEKYNTWVPPEGQTGDGKTRLNEKFGY